MIMSDRANLIAQRYPGSAHVLLLGIALASTSAETTAEHVPETHSPTWNSQWRATWPKVPAMIFGANVSGPENTTQLQIDSMYPLVIYGWQHEDNSSNWTHVGQRLSEHCAALKRTGASSLCVVYHSVACSQPWFDSDAVAMADDSRRHTWFLQNTSPVVQL